MTATDDTPTARGRELVRGAYDMHVHIAPDTVERIIDDVGWRAAAWSSGWRASSSSPTTRRPPSAPASSAAWSPGSRSSAPSRSNRAVGGHEPARGRDRRARGRADRVAADRRLAQRDDGRARDRARRQAAGVDAPAAGAARPGRADRARPRSSTRRARCCPRPRRARRRRASRMVLATGHLNRDEIFAVVDAAVEKGIETIVITHPEFPASGHRGRGSGRARRQAARCSSAASPRRTPAR